MRGQARIVHGGDRRLVDQRFGQMECRRRLVCRAHGQGANAADGVERVVRRWGRAVQHRIGPDSVDQLLLAGDHAQCGVVEAGNALGGRVQREVHTVCERLLAEWCGEGRVDHGDRAAQCAELVEVDELESRVRRCLGQRQHGAAGPDCGRESARLGSVDQGRFDAHALTRTLQERQRAGVELALGDDVVAAGAEREHARWRSPPFPRRTPRRRRRLRARRWPLRTNARSGWSSGCRTRRPALPSPAGWRRRGRRIPRSCWPTRPVPAIVWL